PFNPVTVIRYALPVEAMVTLKIYDILGREIRTLVNEGQGAGYVSREWDGRNESGVPVVSGTYFYRLTARPSGPASRGSFVEIKKMILLK
ncbi:MAG TPA: FlgD immunoglobulin-like domain containing protein, partial [Bacteroidota bacterium]|nr:FlgD immunoglobulin-like domain containing protein [Bacteroidota bacterium]